MDSLFVFELIGWIDQPPNLVYGDAICTEYDANFILYRGLFCGREIM